MFPRSGPSAPSNISVQFSPSINWVLGKGGGGVTWQTIQQRLFQCFLQEAIVSSSSIGRDVPSLMLFTLKGALKDGFGEAVVACDMPEPCKFPSLDSCQKRFQWAHKEVDLAQNLVVGFVLHI